MCAVCVPCVPRTIPAALSRLISFSVSLNNKLRFCLMCVPRLSLPSFFYNILLGFFFYEIWALLSGNKKIPTAATK